MRSALYVAVKQVLSLTDAADIRSVRVLQSKVLLAMYEMGHGMFAAAAATVGACAKAARLLGLGKPSDLDRDADEDANTLMEERRRIWWSIFNLDRYVELLHAPLRLRASSLATSSLHE